MASKGLSQENVSHYGSILGRRDFLKYSMATLSYTYLTGCSSSDSTGVLEYPIDSTVMTTRERTVIPSKNFTSVIAPENLQCIYQYDDKGYGVWEYGDALKAVVRNDLISETYTLPVENKPQKLLKFFSISDIHITDKESPAQLIYMQPANIAGNKIGKNFEDTVTSTYSPTMLYTTHVLDAVVQTANALHKQDPIDFGLSLGDTCNSTQYNELRWYIDVLDGKVITPSSGANLGADTIDYQKPFKAAGLDPEIPWYQAIGNHDHFWLGSIPLDVENSLGETNLRASYVSDEVIALPDILLYANNVLDRSDPLYYMGVLDGSTANGNIIKAGPVENFTTAPKVVPDANRRSLTKAEWAEEYFNTTSTPKGHGLNLVPPKYGADFACYSFIPKSTLPLKVIVLDNTQREDDGDTGIHGRGFLDEERWTWLKAELAAGTNANQLMIIACHVPIAVMPYPREKDDPKGLQSDTYMDWYDNTKADMENAVTLQGLIDELHSHPNLLMWMAGHRHVNTVKGFVHDDVEKGFWHVETSSLHDFPQQMRFFEISLNSDYTISIDITNVDPAVKEGTPAWMARKYAVAAQQIVQTDLSPKLDYADPKYDNDIDNGVDSTIKPVDSATGSYNATLLKQLSPTMIEKMQTLFPIV